MEKIKPHHASDRRCYNGAYSSDLQLELDRKKQAKSQLKQLGGSITYFPAGSYYVGFKKHKPITGDIVSFWACYRKTFDILTKKEKP